MNMNDASGTSVSSNDTRNEPVPAYSELFPELNSMLVGVNKVPSIVSTTSVGAIRPSTATMVFRIGVEEQRLLAGTKADDIKQRKVVEDVTTRHHVSVDMSFTKDGTLCVVISGKNRKSVDDAKTLLMNKLQKQAEVEMVGIPLPHYAAIIGRGGEILKNIQQETGTRIKIPAADDIAGVIRITGTVDGCGRARTMIQGISDVEANRARVKLPILKAYHPLVAGNRNEQIKAISKATGAAIHVPPSLKAIDEITITGEKKAVEAAAAQITAIYEALRVSCGELAANIKKSQHRFIVGPRGVYLEELQRDYGVVLEIPPTEEDSDTIVLRGPQNKLVNALTKVFERANSMTVDELEVPGWLHRLMIGKKGATLTELTKPFPGSSIDFCEESDLIKLEGPPSEVVGLKQLLQAKRDEMIATLATVELRIDPTLHARIIGKQGNNISKIKDATGVQIHFPRPEAKENPDLIMCSGPKDGVQQAVDQINDLVKKIQNFTEIKYKVEQRFHSLIIGSKGSQIKKMVAECGEVSVDVPKNKADSDEITISGDKATVAKAKTYLDHLVKELNEANYELMLSVYKPYHGTVIGKSGITVNKIKEATGVRIDIPKSGEASELITLTGPKDKCEEARKLILEIQDGIATIISDKIRFADSLEFKARTVIIPAIRQASGGVLVTPGKGELELRGPKEDVANARDRLAAVATKFAAGKAIETVDVPKKHFKQLNARQAATVDDIEAETGALVFVPPSSVKEGAVVTLVGTPEACKAAAAALLAKIEQLNDVTKETLEIPKKFHKEMLAKRGKFFTDVKDKTGVNVSLPKDGSESLKLDGSRTRMAEAVQMVKDFVTDVETRVTVKITIPARDHRVFFVNKGAEISKITDTWNVSIKIPDRRSDKDNRGGRRPAGSRQPKTDGAATAGVANGGADAAPDAAPAAAPKARSEDTITIKGTPTNCVGAEAALREMLPVEETMNVDPTLHRFIIGKGGEAVRKFMAEHNVNINFGKNDDPTVRIRGDKEKVATAIAALETRVVELEGVKAEMDAKSFKVDLSIDARFHVRLIGKQGASVNKLREEFGVEINFPDRHKKLSATDAKRVTVMGYEEAAKKAADHIMSLVEELQSMVTIALDVHPACHSKIIGRGGATIKALQSKHKVRVLMPREDGGPVKIEGSEKAALDCKDDILEMEEEWKQDEDEYDDDSMYTKPSRYDEKPEKKEPTKSFKVKDAPWEAPTAASFPGLGGSDADAAAPAVTSSAGPAVWARPSGGGK